MNNMKNLVDFMQKRAEYFLKKNGEFAPFGAYIRSNGEITDVLAYSENISSKEIYSTLLKALKLDLQDEDIRASAIGLDGKIDGKDVFVIEIYISVTDTYQAIYPYKINYI